MGGEALLEAWPRAQLGLVAALGCAAALPAPRGRLTPATAATTAATTAS